MKCPYCGNIDDKVLDTRPTEESASIRRRRECLTCNKRFTTYEVVDSPTVFVVKKDGSRQLFDREKILRGLTRACQKRPVASKTLEDIATEIEQSVKSKTSKEVDSSYIGELLMKNLKETDIIAYVRFVSVYKDFNDINAFTKELDSLIKSDK